ncbi:MAG: hypothetical protein PHI97_04040 [Desulfobulbus sp.]|nr:hypothetical protein [Desulfobulbus sp.]
MYSKRIDKVIIGLEDLSIKKINNIESRRYFYEGRYIRLKNTRNYCQGFPLRLRKNNIPIEYNIDDPNIRKLVHSFSSFTMNPKHKSLFEKYYYTSEENAEDYGTLTTRDLVTEQLFQINSSKQIIHDFVQLLIEEARKLIHHQKGDDLKYCKYAIVGRPGTGKTALINYCFSVYGEQLDEERIIYVRINLNEIIQDGQSLRTRMLSKWLRIFCKYYFRSEKFDDFKNHFVVCDEIRSRIKKYRSDCFPTKTQDDYDLMVNYFIDLLYDLHTKTFHSVEYSLQLSEKRSSNGNIIVSLEDLSKMTEILMSYVQVVKNWGSIIIFDGFDRVTFDKMHFDQFKSWCMEIKQLSSIEDNRFCKSVFIVTLRDYSIRTFFRHNNQGSIQEYSQKGPNFLCLSIKNGIFKEIIEKRFEMLDEKFPDIDVINIKRNLINLMYMSYNKCGPQKALDSDWKEVSKTFENIFVHNYRLLFKYLRDLVYLIYRTLSGKYNISELIQSNPENKELLHAFMGQEWRILKLFITGTSKVVPFSNRISYGENGQPIFQGVVPVIPNIFNFNEFSNRTEEASYYIDQDGRKHKDEHISSIDQANKLLLKYHALKILELNGGTLGVETLIRSLNANFCKKWFFDIIFEIRELIFSNVISCDLTEAEYNDMNKISTNFPVTITPKFDIIKFIIEQSVYYENIIDDTPIEERFAKDTLRPLNPVDCSDIWEYLKEKSFFIIYFLHYINYVENQFFENLCESKSDHIYDYYQISKNDFNKNFRFFKNINVDNIKSTINAFLNTYLKNINNDLAESLLTNWEEYIINVQNNC